MTLVFVSGMARHTIHCSLQQGHAFLIGAKLASNTSLFVQYGQQHGTAVGSYIPLHAPLTTGLLRPAGKLAKNIQKRVVFFYILERVFHSYTSQ